MRRLALASLLVLACAAAPTPRAATPPAAAGPPATPAPAARKGPSISGKVVGPDGKPAAGATVRVIGRDAGGAPPRLRPRRPAAPAVALGRTGTDGAFEVTGLEGAVFQVRVEAKGAAPALADKVPAGASVTLRLRPGVAVSGRVLDLGTGKPVAGATVRAVEHDADAFGFDAGHTARTGESGEFTIPDCGPGEISLEAVAPAHARARRNDIVARKPDPEAPPKPGANTLYLGPGGRLAGRVVGADGKPVEGATVWTSAADGALFAMLREAASAERTDPSGRFEFDGLPAGRRVVVHAAKPGTADADSDPIAVDRGTDRGDIELRLDSGAAFKFKLLTADDAPVTEADVALQPHADRSAPPPRRGAARLGDRKLDEDRIAVAADGTFTVRNVEPGVYDLTVEPADYADVTRDGLRLGAGATADLGVLRVRASKSVSGAVSDASGRGVAGAAIAAFWFDGNEPRSREARSKADGRYKIAGLGDEPVRNLWVSAEGYAPAQREGAEPGDTAVDFTLERLGAVSGRVLMPDGSVPAAFEVEAHPEAKAGTERQGLRVMVGAGRAGATGTFSDPSGAFRLDGVEPGTVTIEARAQGAAPGRKTGLTVRSDQVTDAGTVTLSLGRTLHGRVLAAKDDAPVAGATITLSQPQGFVVRPGSEAVDGLAVSSPDGAFEIEGLEPRAYAVAASQPDFAPASGRVEIPADQDVDDFVVHMSRGGILTGLVRDAQKQPLPGAQVLVSAMPMRSGGPQTATTGPEGRYTFEKLAPGDYVVMRAPGAGRPLMLISGMKQATVREGETTEFDLDESAAINLTGRVLRGGQPLPNATLLFSLGAGGGAPVDLKSARTDDAGRYQVGLDKPGAYAVVVSTGGFTGGAAGAVPIQVPDEPNPVVDIQARSAGISGHVTASDGKPVGGAVVTATLSGGGGKDGPTAVTDVDGAYRIEGLAAGSYKVAVAAAGHRNADNPQVTVGEEGETSGIDFTLDGALSIRGHVVDAGGRGISGAMVVVAPSGTASSGRETLPASTDVNGAFVLTAPVDGPVDLTAVAAGYAPARATGVNPAADADVTLQVPRGGRIRVAVTGADGAAVAGAAVSCRAVPEFPGAGYAAFLNRPPATGADGVSVVGPLAAGSYECAATYQAKRGAKAVDVGDGAEATVAVVLP